jgi:serine/threonine protein kinase
VARSDVTEWTLITRIRELWLESQPPLLTRMATHGGDNSARIARARPAWFVGHMAAPRECLAPSTGPRVFVGWTRLTDIGAEPLRTQATFHDRYEVVRVIRSGGMGAVYEVVDRVTRRSRAMKTMLPSLVSDPDARARFEFEATVAAGIHSGHVVEVFDAGIDDASGLPFLVMELLDGEDLGTLLQRRGRLGRAEVVTYLSQTALALDKTHEAGVVHRDLKPENLFLTARDDGSAHVKILDFGIAKVILQSSAAKTTRNVGTPLYMSPEQIRGEGTIGAASDRYACGHMAYTLLVGEAYWSPEARVVGGAAPLLMRILQGPPERATVRARANGVALPEAFDPWFARATASNPTDRFESARVMIEALARVLEVAEPAPGPRELDRTRISAAFPGENRQRPQEPFATDENHRQPREPAPAPNAAASHLRHPRVILAVSAVGVALTLGATLADRWYDPTSDRGKKRGGPPNSPQIAQPEVPVSSARSATQLLDSAVEVNPVASSRQTAPAIVRDARPASTSIVDRHATLHQTAPNPPPTIDPTDIR